MGLKKGRSHAARGRVSCLGPDFVNGRNCHRAFTSGEPVPKSQVSERLAMEEGTPVADSLPLVLCFKDEEKEGRRES